eukprot:PhM_4_TR11690/c0_g1_i1/m.23729
MSSNPRYVLGKRIGEGAFGAVHLGMDVTTSEHVAVKIISVHASPETIAKAEQEFLLLKKLEHEHIVRVKDFEVLPDKSKAYIYMEWMAGGSVQSTLSNFQFRLHELLIRRLTHQALLGLLFLHSNGVIHRDIKPANFLITNDGILKLSDFGTCRAISESASIDKTTNVTGTIAFMSPEAIRGECCGAADVWALGASIIQMATNRPPWAELGFRDAMPLMFHIGSLAKLETNDGDDGNNQRLHPQYPSHLSETATSFLDLCFVLDSKKRATVQELLQHPFVADCSGTSSSTMTGVEPLEEYLALRAGGGGGAMSDDSSYESEVIPVISVTNSMRSVMMVTGQIVTTPLEVKIIGESTSRISLPVGFGSNNSGQLGVGQQTQKFIAQPFQLRTTETNFVGNVFCGPDKTFLVGFDRTSSKPANSAPPHHRVWACGGGTFDWAEIVLSSDLQGKIVAIAASPTRVTLLDVRGNAHWFHANELFRLSSNRVIRGVPLPKLRCEQVVCGTAVTAFRMSNGDVFTTGLNRSGALGIGLDDDTVATEHPVRVNISNVASLAAGDAHFLATTQTGDLYAWGANQHGQLGLGDQLDRAVPERVPNMIGILSAACGDYHSVVSSAGVVHCAGDGRYGQLGCGSSMLVRFTAVLPGDVLAFHVGAGGGYRNAHTVAVGSDGVFVWGSSEHGQTGEADVAPSATRHLNVHVNFVYDVHEVRVACGWLHTILYSHINFGESYNKEDTTTDEPQQPKLGSTSAHSVSAKSSLARSTMKEKFGTFRKALSRGKACVMSDDSSNTMTSTVSATTSTSILVCENGHPLAPTDEQPALYVNTGWACDLCDKALGQRVSRGMAYHCATCHYDVCPDCVAANHVRVMDTLSLHSVATTAATTTTTPTRATTNVKHPLCPNKHELSKSFGTPYEGGSWGCSMCGALIPDALPSGTPFHGFHCVECDYDVCPRCVALKRSSTTIQQMLPTCGKWPKSDHRLVIMIPIAPLSTNKTTTTSSTVVKCTLCSHSTICTATEFYFVCDECTNVAVCGTCVDKHRCATVSRRRLTLGSSFIALRRSITGKSGGMHTIASSTSVLNETESASGGCQQQHVTPSDSSIVCSLGHPLVVSTAPSPTKTIPCCCCCGALLLNDVNNKNGQSENLHCELCQYDICWRCVHTSKAITFKFFCEEKANGRKLPARSKTYPVCHQHHHHLCVRSTRSEVFVCSICSTATSPEDVSVQAPTLHCPVCRPSYDICDVCWTAGKVTTETDLSRSSVVVAAGEGSPTSNLIVSTTTTTTTTPLGPRSTVSDVVLFLASLSLSRDYGDVCLENHIDGEVILTMSEADWSNVGVSIFGDRRKIINALQKVI